MAGKTVKLDVGIWFNETTGHIHIADRRHGIISTICDRPGNKRSHPHLFKKLAKCLRDAGAPAPTMHEGQEAEAPG